MIFYFLIRFFRGRVEASGSESSVLRLANLCSEYNVPVRFVKNGEKGAFLAVSGAYARRLRELCEGFGVDVSLSVKGFPKVWELYKMRVGLAVGAALAVAGVLVSDLYVWSIDVVGNVTVPEEQVLACLEKSGLRVGAKKSALDLHMIAINAELEIDSVAWLSVNLKGTRAVVEMRETVTYPEGVDLSAPTDLIAARDGQIVYTEATSGAVQVKRYDVVTKGDLLISGIVDSKAYGFKTVRSVGRVLAQTERVFTASAPTAVETKRYTGRKRSAVSVSVFGKTFSLGKGGGFENADRVYENKKLVLFSTVVLPVTVVRETFIEYEKEVSRVSAEEALAKARSEVLEQLRDELSGAQILSKTERTEEKNGNVTVTLRVRCIEDICTERLINR